MTCELCTDGEYLAFDLSALAEGRYVCAGCGRDISVFFDAFDAALDAQDASEDDALERALMASYENFTRETAFWKQRGRELGLVRECCELHATTVGHAVLDSIERRN